jgi:hypothetical protein
MTLHQKAEKSGHTLIVVIHEGIHNKQELLTTIYEGLGCPVSGLNWDALADRLDDLSWLSQRRIILHHKDFTNLSAEDFCTYLEILREASSFWIRDRTKELVAVFGGLHLNYR